jgi:site-specific recombinase XerD
VLDPPQVLALMNACHAVTPTGIRNRALIVVLYRAGLRINEALALLPRCLDARRGLVRVEQAKGGRSRVVGMDTGAWAELQTWLDRRVSLGLGETSPVFCTLTGRRVSDAYVRRLLPQLARKAGLQRRVHAHALRHTHAAELRFEGVDIGVIAKQLGHASIATTAHYLDHIAPLSVIDAMHNRRWPVEDPSTATQPDDDALNPDASATDPAAVAALEQRLRAIERRLSAAPEQ